MDPRELRRIVENAAQSARTMVAEMQDSNDIRMDWPEQLAEGHPERITLAELITSRDGGGAEYVEKVTYDAYRGRENVALLYRDIYESTTDANYPEVIIEKSMGPVQVVFVRHVEASNVRFGTLAEGEEKMLKFFTYAAGIEITEDMIEWNKTWEISDVAIAFGEAYNKLLNHLHLSPIISGTYTTTGGGLAAQKAAQESGTPQLIAFATDIQTTLRNALTVLPAGSRLLANSFDRIALEDALSVSFLSDDKTPDVVKRTINPSEIIYYDGDSVTVGDKTYTYTGVAQGFVYLLVPKRQFKERIKHDLRLKELSAEPRRLIAGGQVGVTRRAVYAALDGEFGCVKVDIAA